MLDDLVEQSVELPAGSLKLLQPRESVELPDVGGIRWAPVAPYWSVLWRSSEALARELEGLDLAGSRVVELGCGLGLPSIAAARAGARVLATDADPEALELVGRNAALNGVEVATEVIDWADPERLIGLGPFDLALASDVLYGSDGVAALDRLLPRLATTAWLADPGRPAAEPFIDGLDLPRPSRRITRGVVRIYQFEIR